MSQENAVSERGEERLNWWRRWLRQIISGGPIRSRVIDQSQPSPPSAEGFAEALLRVIREQQKKAGDGEGYSPDAIRGRELSPEHIRNLEQLAEKIRQKNSGQQVTFEGDEILGLVQALEFLMTGKDNLTLEDLRRRTYGYSKIKIEILLGHGWKLRLVNSDISVETYFALTPPHTLYTDHDTKKIFSLIYKKITATGFPLEDIRSQFRVPGSKQI